MTKHANPFVEFLLRISVSSGAKVGVEMEKSAGKTTSWTPKMQKRASCDTERGSADGRKLQKRIFGNFKLIYLRYIIILTSTAVTLQKRECQLKME